MKKYRQAYETQKSNAKRRGIEWQFTYGAWLEWWGDDLSRRGTGADELQMQRVADTGPYHPDNVRKGVPKQNQETRARMYHHRESREARATILAAEMEKPARVTDYFVDELTEDHKELLPLTYKSHYSVYGV